MNSNGIGCARVFRDRLVVKIDEPCDWVKGNVFQNRPKLFRRGVDLRLGRFGESDHLGVASAFEVEHALIAPAVLIVADQAARGIGGKRRFSGAAQAEEQCHIVRIIRVNVCRTMHGQHPVQWQQIIQDREYRFLDLTRISRVADDGKFLFER